MHTKWLSLLLVVVILGVIISPSWAQDDWQTYMSDDENLSFQYPDEWYVFTDDFNNQTMLVNSIGLVNRPVFDVLIDFEPGQLGLAMGTIGGTNAGNVTLDNFPNSIEIGLGTVVASLVYSLQLKNQIYEDNGPVTIYFSEPDYFEIGGHDAVQIRTVYDDQEVWFIQIDFNGQSFGVFARSYLAEMDLYEEMIMQVLASIVFEPNLETETTTSFMLDQLIIRGSLSDRSEGS